VEFLTKFFLVIAMGTYLGKSTNQAIVTGVRQVFAMENCLSIEKNPGHVLIWLLCFAFLARDHYVLTCGFY